MKSNNILPFWQEIGNSTSIIAQKVGEKISQRTSHTGTLDPLASGVVLIITGDEYFNKEKYIQEDKTYEFNILFGISTDTHDAMGVIDKSQELENSSLEYLNEIKERILGFKGHYHQKYPDFSSKKFKGKHLWEYHRLGLEVPEFYIDGEIKDLILGEFSLISNQEVCELFTSQIKEVSGNFRQGEILKQYLFQNFPLPQKLLCLPVTVTMSRGLYVRGLVRDISKAVLFPALVFNLVRTKDGEYDIRSCTRLSDYFNKELDQDPSFLKPKYLELPKN